MYESRLLQEFRGPAVAFHHLFLPRKGEAAFDLLVEPGPPVQVQHVERNIVEGKPKKCSEVFLHIA